MAERRPRGVGAERGDTGRNQLLGDQLDERADDAIELVVPRAVPLG
jgi:hypothetical protein